MSPFQDPGQQVVTPSAIHRNIGDFAETETAQIPAKYFARISQGFTSSKPTVQMKASQITTVPDLVSKSGSLFSDGVGLISPKLAKSVVEALRYDVNGPQTVPPTCFQIRLGGAKGMVQVDPALHGRTIALRPSQVKFRSSLANLEVAGVFGAGPAFLNRPLIKLLEDLGIHPSQFLKLQNQATATITSSRATMASATTLLRDWNLAPETGFVAALSFLARHSATRGAAHANPFVAGCLDAAIAHALREIKFSGRIPLPGCYNLVGVVDVDGCLSPDEIYVRIVRRDGSFDYLAGRIAISRSPTNHPGDCRIVHAVGRLPKGVGDRIKHLHNCVVFSSQGSRSVPSKLAGGDLDGDVYLLLTEESELVPNDDRIAEPAAYEAAPVVKLDRPVEVADGADFFFENLTQDRTGLVATRQLHLSDAYPEGLFHPACLKLAQLHSDAVDAQKSGTFVPVKEIPEPPPKGWPDFLTDSAQDSYRSSKALGQLYRAVSLDRTDYASPFDSPYAVDPLRTLTTALSQLALPHLSTADRRLPSPQAGLITHFRGYLPSLSAELFRLDCSMQPGQGTSEEALFLSVSLGSRRLHQSDRAEISRIRERASMLFAVVRKVIADGQSTAQRDSPPSTEEQVLNAWAASHAAVYEGEDRTKAHVASANGKAPHGRREEKILGLRIWGWLALGVLVEQLERLDREKIEVLTID